MRMRLAKPWLGKRQRQQCFREAALLAASDRGVIRVPFPPCIKPQKVLDSMERDGLVEKQRGQWTLTERGIEARMKLTR